MRLSAPTSLRTRLFAALVGSTLAIAALSMAVEYERQYRIGLDQTVAALEEQARALQVIRRGVPDAAAFYPLVDAFCAQMNAHISPGHHILVLDPNGALAVSARRHGGAAVETLLLGGAAQDTVLRLGPHRVAQYRLVDRDGSQLVLAQYLDRMEGLLRGRLLERALAAGVTALVTVLCIGWAVSRWVIRPLQALNAAARRWGGGDLGARAAVLGPRDFRLVATEFNTMAEQLAAQEQTRRSELEQAAVIQANLLPPRTLTAPGLRIASAYRPAAQVAGDLYDVFPLPDGRTAVAILDVCGHGISAALLTGVVKMSLHRHLESEADLSVALARVNADVLDCTPAGRFVTACVGIWHPATRRWTYGAAGHPGGLHLNTRRVHVLPGTGPLLGVIPVDRIPVGHLTLHPGERLFLYTDGLVEIDTAGQAFDTDHLATLIARTRLLDVDAQTEHILRHVMRFAGSGLCDDVTLLALEVPA